METTTKSKKKAPSVSGVAALSRDEVQQAGVFNREQALALVGMYYSIQKLRVGAGNKISAHERRVDILADSSLILHLRDDLSRVEKQAARGLKAYAEAQPLGRWAMSILGVGPVIAAGLLAHIDMSRAVTAGAIWSFAGLNPQRPWLPSATVGGLVRGAFSAERSDSEAMLWLSRAVDYRVSDLYAKAGHQPASREQALEAVGWAAPRGKLRLIREAFDACPFHADNAVLTACREAEVDPGIVYGKLYGRVDRAKLERELSRRPYNAALKSLLWKLGESFKKASVSDEKLALRPGDVKKLSDRERLSYEARLRNYASPGGLYARLYSQRKKLEEQRNDDGLLGEAAAKKLEDARRGKWRISAEQQETWAAGRIQPKGLDLRAARFAVKIFLSHLHFVGRTLLVGKAPEPWVIAHGGHTKWIAPPHWNSTTNQIDLPGLNGQAEGEE